MSLARPRLRSLRSRQLRLPSVLVALALLLGAGVAAVVGVRNLEAANRSLEHTYRVINILVSTEAALHMAEASARGYRITARDNFRPMFFEATTRAARQADELAVLTRDNPTQHTRAGQYASAVREHLQAMEILMDLPAVDALADAERERRIDQSVSRMERLGVLSRQIMASESELLQVRQQHSQREATLLIIFVVLALSVALALLGLLVWGLLRENRRSLQLEREARTAVGDLQRSLAARDALSEQRRAQSVYAGMLQSCQTRDEIMALTARTITEIVPGANGRCYLSRASRNFLESVGGFGERIISGDDVLLQDQCWALRRGQPHYIRGRSGGLRCAHVDADAPVEGISTLCVPLVAQGNALGLLHVSAPSSPTADEDNDAAIIISIAEQMGMALANLQLRETLRVQSIRDPLTGLFNRRYLEENLSREMLRCERRRLPLSLLMLDIDHFKRFNDRHGHAAGDALLAHVGQSLRTLVRSEDIPCRYGGEEFTIVMPETDATTAIQRAEEIRQAIAGSSILHMGKPLGPITASIGVATAPEDSTDPERLQALADATLYRAKAAGRNRVLHTSHTL